MDNTESINVVFLAFLFILVQYVLETYYYIPKLLQWEGGVPPNTPKPLAAQWQQKLSKLLKHQIEIKAKKSKEEK